MDREVWWATVHGVTKSRTWPSNYQQQQEKEVSQSPGFDLESTFSYRKIALCFFWACFSDLRFTAALVIMIQVSLNGILGMVYPKKNPLAFHGFCNRWDGDKRSHLVEDSASVWQKQQLMTQRMLTGFINHNHKPEAVCFLQELSERLPCLLPLPRYNQGIKLN